MSKTEGIENIYRSVDALIPVLRAGGHSTLATQLHHRLHKVAWTSGSELLEEIRRLLSDALSIEAAATTRLPVNAIRDLVRVIDEALPSLPS